MEKELMSKGNEILDFILKTLQQGKDFVLEQAPDVVKQLLRYSEIETKINIITDIMILIICLIFIYFCIKMLKSVICKKNKDVDYDNYEDLTEVGIAKVSISSIILFFSSIIFILTLNCDLLQDYKKYLQITKTPKAYLIYNLTNKNQ